MRRTLMAIVAFGAVAAPCHADAVRYFHLDGLGNVRAVTNQAGQIVSRHDYFPFGEECTTGPCASNPGVGAGQPRKFTGKERDKETGLDYFGARYYSSKIGRFTTVDPAKNFRGAQLNPQKWNRYAYSLNNPLKYIDPDGLEEVTVTYRTFIPDESTTVAGTTFAGDNRTFSTDPGASSRTSISVVVETDRAIRANPIVSQSTTAGETRKLDASGNVIGTTTASSGLPVATGARDAAGNVVINIQQNAKNPLSPGPQSLTPGIRANVNVTVARDASTASVSGTVSAFPAHEVLGTRAGGATVPIGQFAPGKGRHPANLMNDRELRSANVPLPPP